MDKAELLYNDACGITKAFFYYMCYDLSQVSCDAAQRLPIFYYITEDDPATPCEWKYDYVQSCHKPFSRKEKGGCVTLEEAFSVTVAYASSYSYRLDLDLFELTVMLNMMRSFPHLYKNEWRIWQESFRAVCEGRVDERIK